MWALIGRAILDYCCTHENTEDWITARDFLFQEDCKGPETLYDWLSYVHDQPDALIERLRHQLKNDQSLKQSLRSAHIFGYRDSLVRQAYKRKFAQ